MKYNLLKSPLVFLYSLVFLFACNQVKKSNIESNENETVENEFKLKNPIDTTTYKTIYNDGRTTGVRNLRYYNYLVKNSKPFGDTKLGLTTIMTEWNAYDANVAFAQGSFIEKPMPEFERKEMIKSGTDPNDSNSTMLGGDEETNRRIKKPSIRYWAVASKMFEQEFKNLKKVETISNRDTSYVTFDFITTNGFYTVQELKSELESGNSIWSNLFKESKFLNTEMERVQNEWAMDAQKQYEKSQINKIKLKK